MDTLSVLGSAAGLGLLAGIRLYFTVFALGFTIRMGWFEPATNMEQLSVLAQTPVLLGSGAMFLAEFVADKVPWFDSIWDAIHTFIRPVGAAALGITALGSFDPSLTVLIGLLSGGVALGGHAAKAATRVAANHSPEPFSNWILSFAEDALVPFGLWVVVEHPLIAAVVVAVFLIVFLLLAAAIWRLFRSLFTRFGRVPAR
ncbi:MAG TPA: DUF4126 domain-containing protein [Bryobacteraceae bacterium]|nr:DUF4126 domain-containing protein [Bryobacteraceae bacterium]